MAASVLKYTEWTDGIGNWYCNDISNLSGLNGLWWVPARMLNLSPAEYAKMLIERFKPDNIKYFEDTDVLVYSWKSINDCRKFKNWLNAEARKYNFKV